MLMTSWMRRSGLGVPNRSCPERATISFFASWVSHCLVFVVMYYDIYTAARQCLFRFAAVGYLHYNSSRGVSGVMTNSPALTLAGLSGFGAGVVFTGGGGVSVFLSFLRLNSLRYLARVGGFISMPFSWSFSAISWVSKPRFFIRSSVGARAKIACSFAVLVGHFYMPRNIVALIVHNKGRHVKIS